MTAQRLFIACDFSVEVINNLALLINTLKRGDLRTLRWVNPANLHLTLVFLGDVDTRHIPLLRRALDETKPKHQAFEIELKGVGVFPNPSSPRVFWAGISNPAPLAALRGTLLGALPSMLNVEAGQFSPHVTLARIKAPEPGQADTLKQLAQAQRQTVFGISPVSQVILYKSDLLPQGPRYTPVYTVNLT